MKNPVFRTILWNIIAILTIIVFGQYLSRIQDNKNGLYVIGMVLMFIWGIAISSDLKDIAKRL